MQANNAAQGEKMPELHQAVYSQQKNQMGLRMSVEFMNFLNSFYLSEDDPNYAAYADGEEETGQEIYYYRREAEKLKNQEMGTMIVDFHHLASFQFNDPKFMDNLLQEYNRFEPYLRRGLTQFLADMDFQIHPNRFYQIGIYNLPQIQKLRELKTDSLGKIMSISGTVTRTTEVKPELQLGTFKCMECNNTQTGVEQQFKYTEPLRCINEGCQNQTKWELVNQDSVFLDWQKIRVQEQSGDIPAGSMPRSIDIILRGDIVDGAKPGDKACFTGTLVVVPDIVQLLKPGERQQSTNVDSSKMARSDGRTMDGVSGLQKTGVRDLSYKMVFIAGYVQSADSRFGFQNKQAMDPEDEEDDEPQQPTRQENHLVVSMKDQNDIYSKLADSVAPTVCGHLDVKKGLLLQLFGGIVKRTHDKIKLRGDINICIVGDPATAKSQFLKYICQFLPRAIYTSGKASTAAGLTASVRKDPETGEFCIEAGALMLADHGICCIDEFDKMDIKDQVAIHEAMEQQTISIAKAGIHATLNARSSILAAANPKHGRYDRSKSLRYNVDISPPIMSRFDLFFVIFDEKKDDDDFMIAKHIVNMHRLQDSSLNPNFSMEELQTYIKIGRTMKPQFMHESAEMLKEEYKKLRQADKTRYSQSTAYRYTVRQLESLIRLSEAMARVHMDEVIRPSYVREVCRLLKASNINIVKNDLEFEENQELINEEVQRAKKDNPTDLFTMEAEQQQQPAKQAETKKVKITYDEYHRIAQLILLTFKSVEKEGQTSVSQADIVNKLVQKLEIEDGNGTSVEKAHETSKKIQNVIQHLITKENMLLVTQDSKIKNERYLCANINIDMENLDLSGQ